MDTKDIVIKPRVWPLNFSDLVISVLVTVPFMTCLFVLPSALMFLLSGSLWLAFLTSFVVYIAFVLFTVWNISLSSEGIRFARLLGNPRFIAWRDIVAVEKAPRRELICKGWLWFPIREMTTSLSSFGHYRIAWKTGFCYYPPADGMSFEKIVSQYRSQHSA